MKTSFWALCAGVAALALTLPANADTKTPQEILVGKWLCTDNGTGSDVKTGFINHVSLLAQYHSDGTYDAIEVGYRKDEEISGVYRMNLHGVWAVEGDVYTWQVIDVDNAEYDASLDALPYWQDMLADSSEMWFGDITWLDAQEFAYRSEGLDFYCKRR